MPSSVVANMKYNEHRHSLQITYVSGAVYNYIGVPADVFDEMKAATSKGTFLNYRIKGKYRYKRIRQA